MRGFTETDAACNQRALQRLVQVQSSSFNYRTLYLEIRDGHTVNYGQDSLQAEEHMQLGKTFLGVEKCIISDQIDRQLQFEFDENPT